MEYLTGILLIVSFLGLIYYCAKGGNLLIGFLVMALLWVIIGRIPLSTALVDVFQKPVENYGVTVGVIIFGSWFGRVLVDTGIAAAIIKKTVELGGARPMITTILLAWATTLIFTSAFGVGSVMAIGVIMLPILFSLGVPKKVAIASYTMSIASGMYLNLGYVKQIQALFPSVPYDAAYVKVALILTAIHMLVIVAFILYSFKTNGLTHAWAATPQPSVASEGELGSWVFLIPAIPIALIVGLKWQPIPALMVAMFASMLLTKKLRTYKDAVACVQQTLYDGIADVGLLIGMLFAIVMFAGAAAKVSPFLGKIFGGILPHDPLMLAIAFGIFAPLALFRGPLMVFGSGGATLAILLGMNLFSPKFLFALIMIPPVAMVANTCPTQSWSMWAINYSKLAPQDYLKTGLIWSWILMLINEIVAVSLFS